MSPVNVITAGSYVFKRENVSRHARIVPAGTHAWPVYRHFSFTDGRQETFSRDLTSFLSFLFKRAIGLQARS